MSDEIGVQITLAAEGCETVTTFVIAKPAARIEELLQPALEAMHSLPGHPRTVGKLFRKPPQEVFPEHSFHGDDQIQSPAPILGFDGANSEDHSFYPEWTVTRKADSDPETRTYAR